MAVGTNDVCEQDATLAMLASARPGILRLHTAEMDRGENDVFYNDHH